MIKFKAKMGKKKSTNQDELLVHLLRVRVSETTLRRMEKLLAESSCYSIGDVARKLLSRKRINCFYRDASMTGTMEELALIRKELKVIGINIKQQSSYFNVAESSAEKAFHADRTIELYQKVELKIERLLVLISKLAEKWLQGS